VDQVTTHQRRWKFLAVLCTSMAQLQLGGGRLQPGPRLPPAGVGSAMNDTTRQLGVAVLDRQVASGYKPHLAVGTQHLPAGGIR
jgi:hypothetical protein